jgi:uncharacterized membrane protein
MDLRLKNTYEIFHKNLFAIPAFIGLIYVLICIGLYYLETNVFTGRNFSVLYGSTVSETRTYIGLLLTSMITVITIVLSMTMVVMNLSVSQLGPRIVRSILTDRETKIIIGMFFGSILTCIAVITILSNAGDSAPYPGLTVSFAYLCCVLNLFVLLFYAHHLGTLSVADSLVTKVHVGLLRYIQRLPDESPDLQPATLPSRGPDAYIESHWDNYIQTIDYEELKKLAVKHDLTFNVMCKCGDYIIWGMNLAEVYGDAEIPEDLQKKAWACFVTGSQRTGSQDIFYWIKHHVEIGLRALSPGINDNYTAILVLDKLCGALAHFYRKNLPNLDYLDENGVLRVRGNNIDRGAVTDESFSRIRNAGMEKPDILTHILSILNRLYAVCTHEADRAALRTQYAFIESHIENMTDRAKIAYMKEQLKRYALGPA